LELREYFSFDNEVIKNIDSVYIEEELSKLIKKNPNEYIFRHTTAKPIYCRPTLFSERFRDIDLNFNPNLSKKELLSQFENIIDLYQTNELNNKSIYEIIGEEFGKYSQKIEREKRVYKGKRVVEVKKISTLLNNVIDILYIYDSDKMKLRDSHLIKSYNTNLSEGTISMYLIFSKFLIDNKGYKFLLTSNYN